jgi:putative nucleotidyltransferase with HDIG domain
MQAKQSILFVDDDPGVLQGLKRMLRRKRDEWDMSFAPSGADALQYMEQKPVDVIVSDMRMPEMNGAQLLEEVRRLYPHVVRLVLSGYSGQELILRSVGPAHQFLAKPCDAETLVQAIDRSCSLHEFLNNQVVAGVVTHIDALPVLPGVYAELVKALADEEISLSEVGGIIAKDVSMSVKILQLVNSAFFGLRNKVEDIGHAVLYLGLDTVKSLVLSASVFSAFDMNDLKEYRILDLEGHCIRVAALAKKIAADAGRSSATQNDALTAGLLHDVGKLILAANFPDKYKQAIQYAETTGVQLQQAEIEIIGATHAQLGGYLLGLWGLPDPIAEAVTLHSQPSLTPVREFNPLVAVHVANILDHEINDDGMPDRGRTFDLEFLESIGQADQLDRWREIAERTLRERAAAWAE